MRRPVRAWPAALRPAIDARRSGWPGCALLRIRRDARTGQRFACFALGRRQLRRQARERMVRIPGNLRVQVVAGRPGLRIDQRAAIPRIGFDDVARDALAFFGRLAQMPLRIGVARLRRRGPERDGARGVGRAAEAAVQQRAQIVVGVEIVCVDGPRPVLARGVVVPDAKCLHAHVVLRLWDRRDRRGGAAGAQGEAERGGQERGFIGHRAGQAFHRGRNPGRYVPVHASQD
jgi:hypothetical protein